ncbi:urease accessory protein UreD [Nocardia aurantia]|uniref:Urease accessory protein UreD n=1 Tax=Nocardia aurantia TaxID=2585199 RepID=A0A7K0DKF2_9NOCA|nr:urease accessory protein UreD [Nocardia aurantia]MQY26286.1 Urease accessory protein UreD [Nocardia aurantia]
MRTELRILARPGAWPHIRATGAMAARATAPDTVHLVGTAATPVGGDELDIGIEVAPGARLRVRTVAATLALPGRETPLSVAYWRLAVGAGAHLDFAPEPTVVADGAEHHTVTTVDLADDAVLHLAEHIQIGRTGEDSGRWRGDLIADRAGSPLLRHRLELGAGASTDDLLTAPRALMSVLAVPDETPTRTSGSAVLLPLAAGGTLFSWTGPALAAYSDSAAAQHNSVVVTRASH